MSIKPVPYLVDVDREHCDILIWQRSELKRKYILKEKIRCAIGTIGHETPAGRYEIYGKKLNPSWTIPNAKWAIDLGYKPGQVIGPGPNNPIKGAFLAIVNDPTGNIGIHGTADLNSLGKAASHGCIRVDPDVAVRLYHKLPKYTPVHII